MNGSSEWSAIGAVELQQLPLTLEEEAVVRLVLAETVALLETVGMPPELMQRTQEGVVIQLRMLATITAMREELEARKIFTNATESEGPSP